jgi:hypothetical protein
MRKKRSLTSKGLLGLEIEVEGKAVKSQSVDENEAFQSKLELQRKVIKNLEALLNSKTSETPEHQSNS